MTGYAATTRSISGAQVRLNFSGDTDHDMPGCYRAVFELVIGCSATFRGMGYSDIPLTIARLAVVEPNGCGVETDRSDVPVS